MPSLPSTPADEGASAGPAPTEAAARGQKKGGREAAREVFLLWGLAFTAILAATPFQQGKTAAAVAFLYLPLWMVRRRGEDYRDYGLHFGAWRQDLKLLLWLLAVVVPLFSASFVAFAKLVPHLPGWLQHVLTPYRGGLDLGVRLPDRFWRHVLDQMLVVALPEEFFYRGYMQNRLKDAYPGGRRILGVTVGRAFWITQALFAIGHLTIPVPWRLSPFFPALVFGWMREKTGSILGAIALHASSNLLVMVLEACVFNLIR